MYLKENPVSLKVCRPLLWMSELVTPDTSLSGTLCKGPLSQTEAGGLREARGDYDHKPTPKMRGSSNLAEIVPPPPTSRPCSHSTWTADLICLPGPAPRIPEQRGTGEMLLTCGGDGAHALLRADSGWPFATVCPHHAVCFTSLSPYCQKQKWIWLGFSFSRIFL